MFLNAGSNSKLVTFSAPMLSTPTFIIKVKQSKDPYFDGHLGFSRGYCELLRLHARVILNTCVRRTWHSDGEHPQSIHNASCGSFHACVLLLYGFYDIHFVHCQHELCVGLLSLYCVTHL
jgi:hypothetical protein